MSVECDMVASNSQFYTEMRVKRGKSRLDENNILYEI
jgi:hypothetical protein